MDEIDSKIDSNNNTKESNQDNNTLGSLVTFRVGKSEYAINIMQAREIIKMEKITIIPNSPSFIEGVINLRGNIIPIIDLKKRFGLETIEGEVNSGIIIVKIEDMDMGIIIDSVSKVISIPKSNIEPPPPVLSGIQQKYIKGVAKVDDKLLVVLDLDNMLSTEDAD